MRIPPPHALACGLLLLALTACGADDAPEKQANASGASGASGSPAGPTDGMVTCGGLSAWPASAMTGADPTLTRDANPELASAVAEAVPGATSWFVLARDGHAAAVATGDWTRDGPGPGARVVELEQRGGTWRAVSWDRCDAVVPF